MTNTSLGVAQSCYLRDREVRPHMIHAGLFDLAVKRYSAMSITTRDNLLIPVYLNQRVVSIFLP